MSKEYSIGLGVRLGLLLVGVASVLVLGVTLPISLAIMVIGVWGASLGMLKGSSAPFWVEDCPWIFIATYGGIIMGILGAIMAGLSATGEVIISLRFWGILSILYGAVEVSCAKLPEWEEE